MVETNPEIIEKTEKRLRNKYGVLMLVNALLSTTFGLFCFIASIIGETQYEDAALAGLAGLFLFWVSIRHSFPSAVSGTFWRS